MIQKWKKITQKWKKITCAKTKDHSEGGAKIVAHSAVQRILRKAKNIAIEFIIFESNINFFEIVSFEFKDRMLGRGVRIPY